MTEIDPNKVRQILAQGEVQGARPPKIVPLSEAALAVPPSRGRVTVIHKVYCQQIGENPFPVETSFFRWLDSDEQPVGRTLKVGEEWTPLYCGWLAHAGALVVTNEEGRRLSVVPTPEEAASIDEKVVELGMVSGPLVEPFTMIPPRGEDIRINPLDLTRLRLRCRKGTAKITVSLIPV